MALVAVFEWLWWQYSSGCGDSAQVAVVAVFEWMWWPWSWNFHTLMS